MKCILDGNTLLVMPKGVDEENPIYHYPLTLSIGQMKDIQLIKDYEEEKLAGTREVENEEEKKEQ